MAFVFNWGIIIGYFSQSNSLDLGITFLFLGGFFFTIAYDTAYAFQDLKDDKKFGIKSFAIVLEKKTSNEYFFYIFIKLYFFFTLSLLNKEKLDITQGLVLSLPILTCFILQFYLFHKKLYKLVFDSSALTSLVISLFFW